MTRTNDMNFLHKMENLKNTRVFESWIVEEFPDFLIKFDLNSQPKLPYKHMCRILVTSFEDEFFNYLETF